jgi:hypothetical protein
MRTKTLLLTAAFSVASLTASMADVFSVNVVGYVNQTIPAGFIILNNPLVNSNNTVAQLFPNPPLFSTIYKFSGGGFVPNTFGFGGWGDPAMAFPPGEAAFFNSPSAFTNTYVGEVLIGTQTNNLAPGFSLVGSKVPQAGALQGTLGLTPNLFDTVYTFDVGTQNYVPNTYGFGGWGAGDPQIAVAEGFFYLNQQSSTNAWVRTFNPNSP